MKIGCISASQVPSTAANSIQMMKACQALQQAGHQVHLYLPGMQQASWVDCADFYGLQTPFELEWLPAQARLKRYDFCLKAVRRALQQGAELLYVWPLQAAVFGLLAHLPVALELHGPPEGNLGPWFFRLFLAIPGRKRLLPITQALVSILARKYPLHIPSTEIVVSPNGIDLQRYRNLPSPPEARQLLGLPQSYTVGYSGHLYPGRGMNLLLDLARGNPGVQFLWVGGRPEDVFSWKDRLSEAKIANVRLVGFVENRRLPLYQAAAEVLLMPYERQIAGSGGGNSADYCSPMKMFEYMACGRAIISSDLPAIREVLNEQNAVFCPPESVETWDKVLKDLISRPDFYAIIAGQAQHDVQQYDWLGRAQRALANFPLPDAQVIVT